MRTTIHPVAVGFFCVAAIVLIGAIDFVTGIEIRIYPLYFLPIALGAWRLRRRVAAGLVVASAAAWLISNMLVGVQRALTRGCRARQR